MWNAPACTFPHAWPGGQQPGDELFPLAGLTPRSPWSFRRETVCPLCAWTSSTHKHLELVSAPNQRQNSFGYIAIQGSHPRSPLSTVACLFPCKPSPLYTALPAPSLLIRLVRPRSRQSRRPNLQGLTHVALPGLSSNSVPINHDLRLI